MIRWRALVGTLLALGGCVERGEVISIAATDSGTPLQARALTVSTGARHACAIIDEEVYCWGANDQGQLGLDTTQHRSRAVRLVSDARFSQIATGSEHSCALDDVGQAFCWGGNQHGQLGLGDRLSRSTPMPVTLPAPATRIATKFRHTCALLLDASLYCWGDNEEGELGQADTYPANDETAADALNPVPVAGTDWRALDTGDGHTCGIRTNGELWCWGRNSDHELGPDTRVQVREPVRVTEESGWLSVSAGQNHTCGVKQDRSIWCWGLNTASTSNEGFPLGIPGVSELAEPMLVGSASDWAQLDTNTFHTCAVTRNDVLFCWGRNAEGQLGLGDLVPRPEPTLVTSGVTEVSSGRFATCALSGGEVRCAGDNGDGQLGTADYERRSAFVPVLFAP
jgi:alpha-tubulin suppressor-like RCC1 family protein